MIVATHMLGLTAAEAGGYHSPTATAAQRQQIETTMAARYAHITQGGELLARAVQPQRGSRPRDPYSDTGRSFAYDDLAGDGAYIFFDVNGTRYTDPQTYPLAIQYGWQWDAAALVAQGALVCRDDLAADYDDLIYRVCKDLAATLPPLPPVTAEELADFARTMGIEDPALLAYVRQASTDPTDDLSNAVLGHHTSVTFPVAVVAQARAACQARVRALQARRRLSGAAALALLHTGQPCELLVPQRLPLATAVACIEAGVIRMRGH